MGLGREEWMYSRRVRAKQPLSNHVSLRVQSSTGASQVELRAQWVPPQQTRAGDRELQALRRGSLQGRMSVK